MEDLNKSINQYKEQLAMVDESLRTIKDEKEYQSLITLRADLQQLIQLTEESLFTVSSYNVESNTSQQAETKTDKSELDDEYALFMQEMASTGAYDADDQNVKNKTKEDKDDDPNSDIEDELTTLLGMKCAVYHTHKWGGQPTLHNAMVSALVPRQDNDQFKDLQVHVLFTHPTHAEMLPCPFYLEGECRFSDEQCRYSHGAVTQLSNLKEAIEPNFESLKQGSRILLKLKPPDDEDISLTKKSSEKYHLWHRAIIKSIDIGKNTCFVKLEQGFKAGDKRKSTSDEINVTFEQIFPLDADNYEETDSDNSLSDTEYPDNKSLRVEEKQLQHDLLVEKSLKNNAPAMGEWERHTRGIGSKLMLAMGYVPGTGLGATSEGRVQPVEARVLPVGKSLDHCMAISQKNAAQDPLKVEQKLKRLQKKEEERNKRAYEREKEKERRNVFNFLNRTLGDNNDNEASLTTPSVNVQQSSSKDLNIEQFKITEDAAKIEREIIKLNKSLTSYPSGSSGHRSISVQILERNRELSVLRNREQQITKEQRQRKVKEKMTVF